MGSRCLHEITGGSTAWDEALAWASAHFDHALLFLGDAGEPLARHARFWFWARDGVIRGVAVRFEGFHIPVVSVAAEDAESSETLIVAALVSGQALLATHEKQPLTLALMSKPATYDPWLDAACSFISVRPDVCPINDVEEIAEFYARQGVHYWHPDMLQFGHCFGVRDASGALVSAGGVNFVLPDHSYAQVGGLVTTAHARGRSNATAVLDAIRTSLGQAGIARLGLFADASNPYLPRFYTARGFKVRGRFRFSPLA